MQHECSWKSEVEYEFLPQEFQVEITEVEAELPNEMATEKMQVIIRSVTTATAAFTTVLSLFTMPVCSTMLLKGQFFSFFRIFDSHYSVEQSRVECLNDISAN